MSAMLDFIHGILLRHVHGSLLILFDDKINGLTIMLDETLSFNGHIVDYARKEAHFQSRKACIHGMY